MKAKVIMGMVMKVIVMKVKAIVGNIMKVIVKKLKVIMGNVMKLIVMKRKLMQVKVMKVKIMIVNLMLVLETNVSVGNCNSYALIHLILAYALAHGLLVCRLSQIPIDFFCLCPNCPPFVLFFAKISLLFVGLLLLFRYGSFNPLT